MHYGHAPHVSSHEDRTRIKCQCGWISRALTREDKGGLGLPWYCDRCGFPAPRFVTYAPHEERQAMDEFNVTEWP